MKDMSDAVQAKAGFRFLGSAVLFKRSLVALDAAILQYG
jgi:hypothetical protein